MKNKSENVRKYVALFSLSLSYAVIYQVVYMKYSYYTAMTEAFKVTNAQLGFLLSMYAIACMVLYIPGGYVADKYSTKKILILSLGANAVLSAVLGFSMNYVTALIVWFLFGITTAFAYWAALIKGVNSLSNEKDSNFVYSIYYFGGGLLSVIFSALLVKVFGSFSSAESGLRAFILSSAGLNAVAAVMIAIFFPETGNNAAGSNQSAFDRKQLKPLLKSPIIWVLSILILCTYGLRAAGSTYFTPYLVNVIGIDVTSVAMVSVIRTGVFPMLAPVSGLIADKLLKSTSKLLMIGFTLLGLLFGAVLFLPSNMSIASAIVVSLLPGMISAMMYGVMYAVLKEAKIPGVVMGTVVGVVSIIGYLPDFVFDPVFGNILDKFGNAGFNIIFTSMIAFAAIGIITCVYVINYAKKINAGLIKPVCSDLEVEATV